MDISSTSVIQAAKDYDIDLEIVQQIAKHSKDSNDFFERLEAFIAKRLSN
jgi:hypothetical protein